MFRVELSYFTLSRDVVTFSRWHIVILRFHFMLSYYVFTLQYITLWRYVVALRCGITLWCDVLTLLAF